MTAIIANPIFRGKGMNYQLRPGAYSSSQVAIDLAEIIQFTNKVRIGMIEFDSSAGTFANAYNAINQAIALGFHVLWGTTAGGVTLTSSNRATFLAAIDTQAAQAFSLGVHEFLVGNEEEYHVDNTTYTIAQVQADMKAKAASYATLYPTMPTRYSTEPGQIAAWAALGLGSLHMIGFNDYNNIATLTTDLATMITNFGAQVYLSEWGNTGPYGATPNEANFESSIAQRLEVIANSGIQEAYYYNYVDTTDSGWGIKISTGYHLAWQSLWGYGNSLNFSAANSYIDLGQPTGLDFAAGAFTIEGWIYPVAHTDIFSSYFNFGSNLGILFRMTNVNGLQVYFGNSAQSASGAGSVLTLNAWHYVAVTYDGTTLKFYNDPISTTAQTTITHASVASDLTKNCYIGAETGPTSYWTGNIAELRVYNRALSGQEILNRYQLSANLNNGLLAQWEFNEGIATTLTDLSGNGVTGTIHNAVYSSNVPQGGSVKYT